MSNSASDINISRQLLTVSELERLDVNQRSHDDDIKEIGKDLAVIKMQVRLILWAGGVATTGVMGTLFSLLL
jgi:hypothetical protein